MTVTGRFVGVAGGLAGDAKALDDAREPSSAAAAAILGTREIDIAATAGETVPAVDAALIGMLTSWGWRRWFAPRLSVELRIRAEHA